MAVYNPKSLKAEEFINDEEILATLGSRVVHVHISDHGEKGDCLPLGSGSFRIRSFLEQLDLQMS